jgi:hypothetical protein
MAQVMRLRLFVLLKVYQIQMLNNNITLIFCRDDKRVWIVSLFFGAISLFCVRTIMSLCALEISKEFSYNKQQTVIFCFFFVQFA